MWVAGWICDMKAIPDLLKLELGKIGGEMFKD
jgi:hypothetical protein